jgi:hypothetical protein
MKDLINDTFGCYSDTWIFTHILKSRECFWVLTSEIEFQNFIMENGAAKANERPERTSDGVLARYTQEAIQALHPHLAPEKIQALTSAIVDVQILATLLNTDYIGRYEWRDRREYERMRREGHHLRFFQVFHLLWPHHFPL